MKKKVIGRRQFTKTTAGLTVPGSVALDFKGHKPERKMLEVIKQS
jgi:hypothetical protein